MMNRRQWLGAVAGAAALAAVGGGARWLSAATPAATKILVYKSPTCGCCTGWVNHLKESGFEVTVRDVADVSPIKQRYGVPSAVASCHTGLVEGYAVEGHVPADVIQTLLKDRPKAVGLAVPGMPIGSPGMEGSPKQRYDVLLIAQNGSTSVFARR